MKREIVFLCALSLGIALKPLTLKADESTQSDLEVVQGKLDGSSWAVSFVPDKIHSNPGDPFQDTLVFKEGVVSLKDDVAQGFDPTEYAFDAWASSITFSMTQAATRNGKKIYEGVVENGVLSGKLSWEQERGGTQHYVFQGTKLGH